MKDRVLCPHKWHQKVISDMDVDKINKKVLGDSPTRHIQGFIREIVAGPF